MEKMPCENKNTPNTPNKKLRQTAKFQTQHTKTPFTSITRKRVENPNFSNLNKNAQKNALLITISPSLKSTFIVNPYIALIAPPTSLF